MKNLKMSSIQDIDWSRWRPVDRATLTFIVKEGEILLIRKKRGLGAGKINGPGGRVEPDETILDCAIREVQEELLVEMRWTEELLRSNGAVRKEYGGRHLDLLHLPIGEGHPD